MPKKKTTTDGKKQKVHVLFIQDRSGSMNSTWKENLQGFETFVNDLKKNSEVDYLFSLTVFDTVVESPLISVPLKSVQPEILAEYAPRGGTALYDAVGNTLEVADRHLSDVDKLICIIVTDGEENSSRGYTKDCLHSMIDAKLGTGKYTFQYLGTQPETWNDAAKVGLVAGSTVMYTVADTRSMYAAVASGVNNFSASSLTMSGSLTADYADKHLVRAANLKTPK